MAAEKRPRGAGEEAGMETKHAGSQPFGREPADCFTRMIRTDPLVTPHDADRVAETSVIFEPGAAPPGVRMRWVGRLLVANRGRASPS
jgi:hypothetical protein